VRNEMRLGTYDGNGNLSSDANRVFVYNDENWLVQVTSFGVHRSEFTYDGFGRIREQRYYTWNGTATFTTGGS
jgi:YD repeat-containing protein